MERAILVTPEMRGTLETQEPVEVEVGLGIKQKRVDLLCPPHHQLLEQQVVAALREALLAEISLLLRQPLQEMETQEQRVHLEMPDQRVLLVILEILVAQLLH